MVSDMTREDCSSVYQIETACFPGTSWKQEDFIHSLSAAEQHYLVARREDMIVGFAAIYVMADTADLVNIAVLPAYQGQGIGTCLMKALLERAVQCKVGEITLEVRASNEAAICLYRSFGFDRIAVRKDYYSRPVEDADIMQLNMRTFL